MSIARNSLSLLVFLTVVILASGLLLPAGNASAAAQPDCLTCHEDLSKGKVVHAAVQMGCTTCHSGIDANDIPHKKTNKLPKGLSAEQPDLCYGCHDKAKFIGKSIHAPVGIGSCTGCHSPHKSAHEKLLLKKTPELCYECHDKKDFAKKNVHMPVEGGMCLGCHKPHVAEEMALLKQDAIGLCFECHPAVRKTPHAVSGFSTAGHPIGLPLKKKKSVIDPARPGKKFYCGSCHNPHSSDWMKLFRYKANVAFEICDNCHKM